MALEKFIDQTGALKRIEKLSQKNIDFIIEHSHKKGNDLQPKGIQKSTQDLILEQLKENPGSLDDGR